MDWWFFREGTDAEARDYLARFIDEGVLRARTGRVGACRHDGRGG